MTAVEELRATGGPGRETALLVYETARAVVRFRNFPPPAGYREWTGEAVRELAHDFLTDGRAPKRWATLAATAIDDEQLGRLLNTSIVNFLRDEARRTDRGHLLARIRDVLGEVPDRFIHVPSSQLGEEHWALPTTVDAPVWQGSLGELVFVAWRVEHLTTVSWRQAERRGPIADRESWHRLTDAVLSHAAGPVPTRVLADVAEHRFSLQPRPDAVPIDAVDVDPPTLPERHPPDPAALARWVEWVWPQLSDRDRLVIAHHDAPVRQLADVLGLGKSAAADARSKAMTTLRALLATSELDDEELDDEERDAVALAVADACRRWINERTSGSDSSSHEQ